MKVDIKKISKLAKLVLTPTEEKKYSKELNLILDYMAIISEVDTKNVPITCQSTGLTGREREDITVRDTLQNIQEELLSSSPNKEDHFIKVPPVF